MTDSAATPEPKRGQVYVLLTKQRRVRHLAVWGVKGGASPLCRNRGEFPVFGDFNNYDGIPCCQRCAQEATLLASAADIAGWRRD